MEEVASRNLMGLDQRRQLIHVLVVVALESILLALPVRVAERVLLATALSAIRHCLIPIRLARRVQPVLLKQVDMLVGLVDRGKFW
jgi:hypothetical protein